MRITKYVRFGMAVEHDIHYTMDNKILRYGTDEDEPEKLKQVVKGIFSELSELVNIRLKSIKKFEYGFSQTKVTEENCKIEAIGSATDNTEIKLSIKIEWDVFKGINEVTRKEFTQIRPLKQTQDSIVKSLNMLRDELEIFVKYGGAQLDFNFNAEDKEINVQ